MDKITQYLEDLRLTAGELYPIVRTLRQLALAAGPSVSEEFKYGGILFAAPRPFCGIFAYRSHVTVEFSAGHALADPLTVLEGKGKLRRHIRLESEAEIAAKQVGSYIVAAANSCS
ncbi:MULTISPECIES: DUF1801 domain-containing protein [Paracoccaceae]|uniref:DUF1801 domain-containing protein n=1 Tax=Paracoccaceae TaxID=31989 RepID=UPI0015742240|nr:MULTISPECIES: DUF1801 domain-containing protein [Paracoccaceae]MBJ2153536.1 DUF1801 domain-containing protein [Paracoccus sp. IB05]NTT88298.1 DUF1801 domain-containing protein [Tabrizicola sp. SY72]